MLRVHIDIEDVSLQSVLTSATTIDISFSRLAGGTLDGYLIFVGFSTLHRVYVCAECQRQLEKLS